jgi:hypothetical protein
LFVDRDALNLFRNSFFTMSFGSEVGTSLIRSRQGQGRLPIADARRLHLVGLVFGLCFCCWLIMAGRRAVPGGLVGLSVFVIAGNAGAPS